MLVFALRFGEGGHRKMLVFPLNRSILSLFYNLDLFVKFALDLDLFSAVFFLY
jgi:hypothetical protein